MIDTETLIIEYSGREFDVTYMPGAHTRLPNYRTLKEFVARYSPYYENGRIRLSVEDASLTRAQVRELEAIVRKHKSTQRISH